MSKNIFNVIFYFILEFNSISKKKILCIINN